jgi:hypothetical protein
MMLVEWVKVPIVLSLSVVAGLLMISIVASLLRSGALSDEPSGR